MTSCSLTIDCHTSVSFLDALFVYLLQMEIGILQCNLLCVRDLCFVAMESLLRFDCVQARGWQLPRQGAARLLGEDTQVM